LVWKAISSITPMILAISGDRGDDVAKGGHGAIEVVPELCVFGRNVVDLHRQVAAGQSLERTAELGHDIGLRLADVFLPANSVLALGVELLLLLGFANPHLGTFAHRVTQDQNRGRHFTDLVLALDFGHFAADILAGNRLHGRIQAADRVHHAANRCVGDTTELPSAPSPRMTAVAHRIPGGTARKGHRRRHRYLRPSPKACKTFATWENLRIGSSSPGLGKIILDDSLRRQPSPPR
jgi:hypothetical protein